jgi:hypothetical protein
LERPILFGASHGRSKKNGMATPSAPSHELLFTAADPSAVKIQPPRPEEIMSEHSAYEHEGGSVVVKEVPVIKVRAWR